jgi:hypothetical protein
MTDAEKAAIVAELKRQASDLRAESAKSSDPFSRAICGGMLSALAVAIQVVQAGGALPPENLSDEDLEGNE